MKFFDALLPLGRTNMGFPCSPVNEHDALGIMDRYDVDRAFIFHTVSRDSDPGQGNAVLTSLTSQRLLPIWGFDPALIIREPPAEFLDSALSNGAKGIMLNPCMRNIRLDKSPKVLALAEILEKRRIPLFLLYWRTNPEDDVIDWYALSEFCRLFPALPVLTWEWRTRSNRPLFDVLSMTDNLILVLSALWQAQSLDALCRFFGPNRIVFSLGLPSLDPGSFQSSVRYADIPDTAKEEVAFGNLDGIVGNAVYHSDR